MTVTIQPIAFAAYEAPTLIVTMVPATNITGHTFILNVRQNGVLRYQTTAVNVLDAVNGMFSFVLTSATTGTTLGVGDFDYDVWRTNSGSEKRLVKGTVSVDAEQWQ